MSVTTHPDNFDHNPGQFHDPGLNQPVHFVSGMSQVKPDLNEPNEYAVGDLKFWALGDRVLILEDEFKSGYECERCNGTGNVTCNVCNGTGISLVVEGATCKHCHGGKLMTCPECQGKGGLLVAPETAQRRPTTGKIVSVGERCSQLKIGDCVMYSNFAGYTVDLQRAGKPICLRILHEPEILCGMSGHLDLRSLKHKSDIALSQG